MNGETKAGPVRRRRSAVWLLFVVPTVFFGLGLRVWAVFVWLPACGMQAGAAAEVCIAADSEPALLARHVHHLARGDGFVDPASVNLAPGAPIPPALPAVMAVGDLLGFSDLGAARVVGALAGAIGAATVALVAWALDRRRRLAVGVVAGALAAANPFWIQDGALLRPDVLLVPVLALLVLALDRALRGGAPISSRSERLIGVLLGAAMLVRADMPVLAIMVTVAVVVVARAREGTTAALRCLARVGGVSFLLVLPWLVFNSARGIGPALSDREVTLWESAYCVEPIACPSGVDDTADISRIVAGRAARFFGLSGIDDVALAESSIGLRAPMLTRWGAAAEWVLIGAGVAGVVLRRRRGEPVWPLAVIAGAGFAVALSTGATVGARLPFDVAALLLAAPAVAHVGSRAIWPTVAALIGPRRRWRGAVTNTIGLGVIGATAFAVRLFVVAVQRPMCEVSPDPSVLDTCYRLVGDSIYYFTQAESLANGQGFVMHGAQSATHPPLYPLLLTGFRFLGATTVQGQRYLLSGVGASGVVLLAWAAHRLAGRAGLPARSAALWAGALGTFAPMFWLGEATFLSESLLLPLVVLVLVASSDFLRAPTWRRSVWLGVVLSAAALTRAEVGMLVVPVAVAHLWPGRGRPVDALRRRVAHLAVVGGVVAVLLAPWVVYNSIRFERLVLMTTTPGMTMADTACDEVFYGELVGYYRLGCSGLVNVGVGEGTFNEMSTERAMTYYRANLDRVPVQIGAAGLRVFEVYRPSQNAVLAGYIEGRGLASSYLGVLSFLLVAPFAAPGLVGLRRGGISLTPFIGAGLVVLAAVSLGGAIVRYRLPLDVALVLAASVGLVRLTQRPPPPVQ